MTARAHASAPDFTPTSSAPPAFALSAPMAVHASRERYFALLRQDPWGFANDAFDWHGENRFVHIVGPAYLLVIAATLLLSQSGQISALNPSSYSYFAAAVVFGFAGKLLCSWIVMRWQVKINYVRKLGLRPWKKLAAFVIPLIVTKGQGSIPDTIILFSGTQLITILTEWNVVRRRVKLFRFAFISWDRLEDRPYTMRYDLLEDVFRFIIYLPFMAVFGKASLIVLIPNLVNEFGDGLAEPIGLRFGRHTYRVRALWHQGKLWAGSFQRSLEGSAAVFIVTAVVLLLFASQLTGLQLTVALLVLPPLMTLAEAVSPHTADGPLIALVGCLSLWAILLL